MNNYKTSPEGLQILKHFEGKRLTAYQDSVGVWTIGYGTTSGVKRGMVITESQAEDLLEKDLAKFEAGVRKLVTVPLSQNQFDALVVFAYNVGLGNLGNSTLLKLLNNRQYSLVPAQFLRWNRAGGQILNGLTKRRKSEAILFSTGNVVY